MKVNVNGYGLLKFKATSCIKFDGRDELAQFCGKVKLPKGTYLVSGEKWMYHDYWYSLDEIVVTPKDECDCETIENSEFKQTQGAYGDGTISPPIEIFSGPAFNSNNTSTKLDKNHSKAILLENIHETISHLCKTDVPQPDLDYLNGLLQLQERALGLLNSM